MKVEKNGEEWREKKGNERRRGKGGGLRVRTTRLWRMIVLEHSGSVLNDG